MSCPKCTTGFLKPADWLRTRQGRVWIISCVNCGWFVYHPKKVIYYKTGTNIDGAGFDELLYVVLRPLIVHDEKIIELFINNYLFTN
jgi:hypothetical protein